MSSLERYNKRKQILERAKNTITVENSINQELVNEFLNSNIDTGLINRIAQISEEHYRFDYDFSVSEEEANEFLEKFKNDFNEERFDRLITDCKKEVINSIVTPFGIGHILAAYDKVGGNVDTVHNARNEVYATEQELKAYKNRGEYTDTEKNKTHNGNENYKKKKDSDNKLRQKGELQNDYNGATFEVNDKTEVDHVVSTLENHNDAGRVLAEIDTAEISNIDENLKTTSKSVNASKGEDSVEVFLKRIEEKEKKIKELESYQSLTDEQKNELERLKRTSDVDKAKLKEADDQAREAINQAINQKYYTSAKFIKNTTTTSAIEGTKMGLQQATGLVMTEFFTAVFDEIMDIYKNGFYGGFDDEKFLSALKDRLLRIAERIKDKWKDVVTAFKDGFISGFISNLATTTINMFITTSKRVVRIIREGFFALLKAVKLLIFPPKNMSFEDAMHEAKKIIASGLIVSLGVILEEYVSKLAIGLPFADLLTSILVGAITGIAVTMTVYYIDRNKDDKEIMRLLIANTDEAAKRVEELQKQLLS